MAERTDKRLTLPEAAALVVPGSRIALGGFGMYERPMAFTRELVRQNIGGLTVVGHVSGLEVDLLAAASLLRSVETSYVGLERFGRAPNFSKAWESGDVEFVAFSEQTSFDRFRASQSGLTFWPAIGIAGSDLVARNPLIVEAQCPLTGRQYFAVPPASVDVVVIHAGRGDRYGNVAMPAVRQLSHSLDVVLAQGCDTVIVTVEEMVSPEELRRTPELVELPAFQVSAVVEAPRGAHPTSVLGHYPADDDSIEGYLRGTIEGCDASAYCADSESDYQRRRVTPSWQDEVTEAVR